MTTTRTPAPRHNCAQCAGFSEVRTATCTAAYIFNEGPAKREFLCDTCARDPWSYCDIKPIDPTEITADEVRAALPADATFILRPITDADFAQLSFPTGADMHHMIHLLREAGFMTQRSRATIYSLRLTRKA